MKYFSPICALFFWQRRNTPNRSYIINSVNHYFVYTGLYFLSTHILPVPKKEQTVTFVAVLLHSFEEPGCVCECEAPSYLMESCTDNNQPTSTTVQPFAAINSGVTKCQHWWRDKTNGREYLFDVLPPI